MSVIQVPEVEDTAEFMQGLLGLESSPASDCPGGLHSVAEYRNENNEVLAYISCDLTSACRLGAALTQVPAGRVDEALAAGELPESLIENLDEIFNICVNLITKPDEGRVVFHGSTHGEIPAETVAAIESADEKVSCFDIQRYGGCRLAVSICRTEHS